MHINHPGLPICAHGPGPSAGPAEGGPRDPGPALPRAQGPSARAWPMGPYGPMGLAHGPIRPHMGRSVRFVCI